jgi:hypothetical protein
MKLVQSLGFYAVRSLPVVEFSSEGYKIRFLTKNQMKLLNFENWSSGELSKIGHHF